MLVEIQESLYPTAKISCGHDCMKDLMHCECNQGIKEDAIKIQIIPATTCTKCVIEIPPGEYMCSQTHSPTQECTPTQEVKVMQDTSSLIVQYKPAVMFCIKIIYHVRKIN